MVADGRRERGSTARPTARRGEEVATTALDVAGPSDNEL